MLKTILSKFTGWLAWWLGLIAAFLLFFGITYAAVTITTTSVTPWTPMTASLWNAVKTDLDNLAAEFNDIWNFNNVTLTSLAADDVLAYNWSEWINQANASGWGAWNTTYVGITSAFTNGDINWTWTWPTEIDQFCEAEFSGSRAMRSSEVAFLFDDITSSTHGWIHCENLLCNWLAHTGTTAAERMNCIWWNNDTDSSQHRTVTINNISWANSTCNLSRPVHCVQDN